MPKEMIKVWEADLSDPGQGAAVVRLMDEYARDPMGGGEGLSAYARECLVPELRRRETAHVVLASLGDEAVGLVICLEGFSTFACRPLLNIHDVVVSARFRGRGICRALFQEVEALARRLGCCKLTLEVLEGNDAAQAAYRSFGFEGYALDPSLGKALFWEKKLG